MPENNIVILRGTLADEPYLQNLPNGTPYLQFFLIVERSPNQMPRDVKGKEVQRADVLRVASYGMQAETDYFYLQKGAAIVVFGWNQSRPYVDRRGGREARRVQQEVNAQLIFYGRNCNFERGDRHRADRAERTGQRIADAQGELTTAMTEQILKMLSVEAD